MKRTLAIQSLIDAAHAGHVQPTTPAPSEDVGARTALRAEGERLNADGSITAHDGSNYDRSKGHLT